MSGLTPGLEHRELITGKSKWLLMLLEKKVIDSILEPSWYMEVYGSIWNFHIQNVSL